MASEEFRVIFAGGSTGGHLMPGAAVAGAIQALLPASRCLFLTTERRAERHCRGAIEGFEAIGVPGTPWSGVLEKVRFPARSLRAAERSLAIMRAFRPHVVVGLGGHNSVVPILVAGMTGIRTALMEPNAVPGRAVRLLGPIADVTLLQWPEAAEGLRARAVRVTGTPVRSRLFGADRAGAARRLGLEPDRLTLLVLGGSQGALALNRTLPGVLARLHADGLDFQILHLTGVDHLHESLSAAAGADRAYRAIGFLERIEDAYAAADLVLSRAGASTLAEITALGLPAVLVPYPHATDDHQRANAAVLARAGVALCVEQSELNGQRLAEAVGMLAANAELRSRMAANSRALGRPEAARRVARELSALAGFGRGAGRPPRARSRDTEFPRAA